MWSLPDIADAVAAGIRARCAAVDAEQAVYGLDSLEETALHPVIESALLEAGYGVHREQRYPSDRRKRRQSEGERCDFVLTPRGRELRAPDIAGTLFDPPDAMDLSDAFWLEMKTVSQHGPEGPSRNYASQLLSTVRQDVTKLSKDRDILHAGVLLVLFVASAEIARHDLGVWQDRCLARGLPIGAPCQREIDITDRHGNAHCTITIYPVSHL
jgi:hypothetical protein